MIFVISPLTVLCQVLLLDTYHQLSVTTVYDHMLSDSDVIDNVAVVENAWLIFVSIYRNLDTARLDCGYGTDTKKLNAVLVYACHLVTFSRSDAIVFRSRFPWMPHVLFVVITVAMLLLGIFSNPNLHSFAKFPSI